MFKMIITVFIFFSVQLFAKNLTLKFHTLDVNDPSDEKLIELINTKKIEGVSPDLKSFYKINDNIYLYDNCSAPRFSGINIINLEKATNEQFALSKCSLASTEPVIFNIDKFSETFILLTTYHEDTYFRVSEHKCDFNGDCQSKNLLVYDLGKVQEPTLCNEQEEQVFSCATGKKVISLCRIKGDKTLVYRFGKPKTTPELEYSSKGDDINKYFKFAESYYGNGSTRELSFERGKYRYTITQGMHNYRENSAGLVVEKDDKKIADLKCNNINPKNRWDKLIDLPFEEQTARGIGEIELY